MTRHEWKISLFSLFFYSFSFTWSVKRELCWSKSNPFWTVYFTHCLPSTLYAFHLLANNRHHRCILGFYDIPSERRSSNSSIENPKCLRKVMQWTHWNKVRTPSENEHIVQVLAWQLWVHTFVSCLNQSLAYRHTHTLHNNDNNIHKQCVSIGGRTLMLSL